MLVGLATIAIVAAEEGGTNNAISTDNRLASTTLRPGLNFVGWIEESTPPTTLFEEVPEIEVIWGWDAGGQRWLAAAPSMPDSLWTLKMLFPGMALGMRIHSEQSVEWKRDTSPTRGKVELRSGSNLVAWAGRDGASVEMLRRGIGPALESLQLWDGSRFTGEFEHVHRGAALHVQVKRDVNWLQPTGLTPVTYWVGEPTREQREVVAEQVRQGLDAVAENFAVEADPSTYILVVNVDIESVIELRGVTAEQGGTLRQKWDQGVRFGNARAHAVRTSIRQGDTAEGYRRFFLHEYAHVIQFHLIGADRLVAAWLMEGHADWLVHLAMLGDRSDRNWAELVNRVEGQARKSCPRTSLVESEGWGSTCPYKLGFLAIESLADEHGEAAILNFWHLVGAEAREQGIAGDPPEFETLRDQARADQRAMYISWKNAFQTAFGISAEKFYTVFSEEYW